MNIDSDLLNFTFSFPVDVFQRFKSGSSFDDLCSQLRDRILTLSRVVVLLGSFFDSSVKTFT